MNEEREVIAWTNSWISKANTDTRRFLLVGDSTIRQIRGSMEVLLKKMYAVDLLAASFSVCDNKLFEYIKVFFRGNEYKYDVIILQYGGHHGFSRLCIEDKSYHDMFTRKYKKLVRYLQRKCKNLFIVTSTSETMDENIEKIDLYRDKEIRERNNIAINVCGGENSKCSIFDLYTLMKDNSDIYKYCDRQHFTRDSDYFISYHILRFVMRKVKSLQIRDVIHKNQSKLNCILGKSEGILIYGAGINGKELYWILKWNMLGKRIKSFVTSNKENEDELLGIPIICIFNVPEGDRKDDVMIISSKRFEEEMKYAAIEQGFQHIRLLDEVKACLE